MLRLDRFHISLRRVTELDLEEIRQGRNSDAVRKNHLFQETITPEMQHEWYRSTLSPLQYFFVIVKRDLKIGLTHMSRVAPDLAEAEYGLFIWDPRFRNSPVAVLTTFIMLDFFFCDVGLQKIGGRVLAENRPIRRICEFFRFHLDPVPGASYLHTWSDRESFLLHRPEFDAFAQKLIHDPDERELRISGTRSALVLPAILKLLP